jgi:hypothetical protein
LRSFLAIATIGALLGQTPDKRSAPLFDFHSSFLVNLHQTLFHEALVKKGAADRRLQSRTPLVATGDVSEGDARAWQAAVDRYAAAIEGKRLLFDEALVKVNNQLARAADAEATFDPAGLPPAIVSALRDAAPVYRKYRWRAQDETNWRWIESMRPLLETMGLGIAGAMENDLQQRWPAAPIRVDVCHVVPEIGHAYTTEHPPHTTYSSTVPELQGLNGFETLFHEASHAFADRVTDALFERCRVAKKNCGDLWHAVLFYTAGEETRRALPANEQANFSPYAYKNGLYERGDYPKYRRLLETIWRDHMDGRIDFDSAVRKLVDGL